MESPHLRVSLLSEKHLISLDRTMGVVLIIDIASQNLILIFRHMFLNKFSNILSADKINICLIESDLKSFDDDCQVLLTEGVVGVFLEEANSLSQELKREIVVF